MSAGEGCRRGRCTVLAAAALALVGGVLAGCSSTNSSAAAGGSSGAAVPASAFTDSTGVTPHSVTIANISTQTGGLFTGAAVGTEAYAA